MANIPQNTQYIDSGATKFPNLTSTVKNSLASPVRSDAYASRYSAPEKSDVSNLYKGLGSIPAGQAIGARSTSPTEKVPEGYSSFLPGQKNPQGVDMWVTPSEGTYIRNFPEALGGGQYAVDPTNTKAIVKSSRGYEPKETILLRGGLSPYDAQIDHVVPLNMGGVDTLANKQIISTLEHEQKTKAQAVALTLLAQGKINTQEAKYMTLNWKNYDVSDVPLPDEFGYITNLTPEKAEALTGAGTQKAKSDYYKVLGMDDLAEKVKKQWDFEVQHPKGTFGHSLGDSIKAVWKEIPQALNKVLGTSAGGEFAKGLVEGASAGLISAAPQEEKKNFGQISARIAGNALGTFLPIGLFARGLGLAGRVLSKIPGLSRVFASSNSILSPLPWTAGAVDTTRKISTIAPEVAGKISIPGMSKVSNALSKINRFGKAAPATAVDEALGLQQIPMSLNKAAAARAKYGDIARNAAFFGSYGLTTQLMREGMNVQDEGDFLDHAGTFVTEAITGGVLGSAGQTLKGYAKVAAPAMVLSYINGESPEDAFASAVTMVGLHGMGNAKIQRLGLNRDVLDFTGKKTGYIIKPNQKYEDVIAAEMNKVADQASNEVLNKWAPDSTTKAGQGSRKYTPKELERIQEEALTNIENHAYNEGWSPRQLDAELLKTTASIRQLDKGGMGAIVREQADIADIKSVAQKLQKGEEVRTIDGGTIPSFVDDTYGGNDPVKLSPVTFNEKPSGDYSAVGVFPVTGYGSSIKNDQVRKNVEVFNKAVLAKEAPYADNILLVDRGNDYRKHLEILNKTISPEEVAAGKFVPFKNPQNTVEAFGAIRLPDGKIEFLPLGFIARESRIGKMNQSVDLEGLIEYNKLNNKDTLSQALRDNGIKAVWARQVPLKTGLMTIAPGKTSKKQEYHLRVALNDARWKDAINTETTTRDSINKALSQPIEGVETPSAIETPLTTAETRPVASARKQNEIINKKLYHGENKKVTEETKNFERVLEYPDHQVEFIKELAEGGDKRAKEILNKFSYKEADSYLKEKFGSNYDAIKYSNKQMPEKGNEYHDLKENKFYSEKPEISEVYSMQNRDLKYKESDDSRIRPKVEWRKFEMSKRGEKGVSSGISSYVSDQSKLLKYTRKYLTSVAKELSNNGQNINEGWPKYVDFITSEIRNITGNKDFKITNPKELRDLSWSYRHLAGSGTRKEIIIKKGDDGIILKEGTNQNTGQIDKDIRKYNSKHGLPEDSMEIIHVGKENVYEGIKNSLDSRNIFDYATKELQKLDKRGYVPLGIVAKGAKNVVYVKKEPKLIDDFNKESSKYLNEGENIKDFTDDDKFIRAFAVDIAGWPKDASAGDFVKRANLNTHRYDVPKSEGTTRVHILKAKTIGDKPELKIDTNKFEDSTGEKAKKATESFLKGSEVDGKLIIGEKLFDNLVKEFDYDTTKHETGLKPLISGMIQGSDGKMVKMIQKGHAIKADPALRNMLEKEYGLTLGENEIASFDTNAKVGPKSGTHEIKISDIFSKPLGAGNEGRVKSSLERKFSSYDPKLTEDMLAETAKRRKDFEAFNDEIMQANTKDKLEKVIDKYSERYNLDKDELFYGPLGESFSFGAAKTNLAHNLEKISKNMFVETVLSDNLPNSGRLFYSPSIKLPLDGEGKPWRYAKDDEVILGSEFMKKKNLKEGDKVMIMRDPSYDINNITVARVINGSKLGHESLGRENAIVSHYNERVVHQADQDGDKMLIIKVGEGGVPESYANAVEKRGGLATPFTEVNVTKSGNITSKNINEVIKNQLVGDDQTSRISVVNRVMDTVKENGIQIKVYKTKPGQSKSRYEIISKGKVIESGETSGSPTDFTASPAWGKEERQLRSQALQEALDSKKSLDIVKRSENNNPSWMIKQVFTNDSGSKIDDTQAKSVNGAMKNIQKIFNIEKITNESNNLDDVLKDFKPSFDMMKNLKLAGAPLTPYQEKWLSLSDIKTFRIPDEIRLGADKAGAKNVRDTLTDIPVETPSLIAFRKLFAKSKNEYNQSDTSAARKKELRNEIEDYFLNNIESGRYTQDDIDSIARWAAVSSEANIKFDAKRFKTPKYVYRFNTIINASPKVAKAYYEGSEMFEQQKTDTTEQYSNIRNIIKKQS